MAKKSICKFSGKIPPLNYGSKARLATVWVTPHSDDTCFVSLTDVSRAPPTDRDQSKTSQPSDVVRHHWVIH